MSPVPMCTLIWFNITIQSFCASVVTCDTKLWRSDFRKGLDDDTVRITPAGTEMRTEQQSKEGEEGY